MLHHGVAIPPEAAQVNGYTRKILERDGEPPLAVYDTFAAYLEHGKSYGRFAALMW